MKKLLIPLILLFCSTVKAQTPDTIKIKFPVVNIAGKVDTSALTAKLAAKVDTSYRDTLHVDKYFNVDANTQTLHANVNNDPTSLPDSANPKLISDWNSAQKFQAKYIINVKDYGAKGDGTTVDTTAFKTAILAARATGKDLYIPSGNYNLPFTQTVELAGIPRFYGGNATLNFSNMTKLNGVPIDSVTYPANTSNAVFTNTGTITFIQSGVQMTKDSVGVKLSPGANVSPGDVLFFTSLTPSPFPQFSSYYSGQRAIVDSFNTSTGMCYLHEKVWYNIPNAYVWKNSYAPNIDFGDGCTFLAKQYNTIIGINAINSSLNAAGIYKFWGKSAISYTNSTGTATVNISENYRPGNGNGYGVTVSDLSNATVLNSYIKGGRSCVASGGGDYWNANQSGGSSGSAAYPCTINVIGGTLAPNQREGYAAIDAHGITRSMFISGNVIMYAPIYSQAENVIANGFTIYANGYSAINVQSKDSTVGVYNFSNFSIYSKAIGVPGAIAVNGGMYSLSMSNGDIVDSSSNGVATVIFPYTKLVLSNLRITEKMGTPFYLNLYNNNVVIDNFNITGGSLALTGKNDSLSLSISNSSFKDVPQTGSFPNGIHALNGKTLKNITLNNVTATGNGKYGVDVGFNLLELHVNGGRYADNGKGLTGALNQAGIRAFDVQNVWANNVDFRSYSGTQAYGIEHYGYGSPAYLDVTNSNFKGNTTAAIYQSSSTTNALQNNIDYDGSLMPNVFGATVKLNGGSDTAATKADVRAGGGSGGTVTTFSKTDGYGITSTVTNPTSTPNYSAKVDTSVIASKGFLSNYLPKSDSTIANRVTNVENTKADTSSITQTADYVIEKVGSTYYARPGFKSGLPAYSNTSFNTVITSAMGQLISGGGILIKRGLYDNLDFITIPYDNITIEGQGKYATVLKLKPSADAGTSSTSGLLGTTHSGVIVKNLQLDGNGTNQTKIDNGSTMTAILVGVIANGSNCIVENCYIHDFTRYGTYCGSTADNNIIRNSRFVDNYWNGITYDVGTNGGKIINCYISGGGDVGISIYGTGHTVSGCTVKDVTGTNGSQNSYWGIGAENDGSTFASKMKIINNTVTGAGMSIGINCSGNTTNTDIEGNYVHGLNTPISGFAYGISLASGSSNNSIKNNFIWDIKWNAIKLTSADSNSIISNHCWDIGMGGTGAAGEALNLSGNNNTIISNTFKGYQMGIDITAGTGNIILANTVYGMTVLDIWDDGTSTVKSGNYGVKVGALLPTTGQMRRSVTGNTTIDWRDYLVSYASLTATRTVTLPSASTVKGQHFIIKDESGSASGTIKITAVGTIDGVVNPDLITTPYGVKRIYSNGTAFYSE